MSSKDLERVEYEGEVVEAELAQAEEYTREELIGMWANSSQKILLEEFRRAKILATAHRLWGRSGMLDFARDVGLEKSAAYNRCRAWWVWGHLIEDGDLSTRLDTSQLDISHWIAATYAPDPLQRVAEAEDEKLSTRAIYARNHEEKEQLAIEEASEEGKAVEELDEEPYTTNGEPTGAEVVLAKNAFICRECGAINEFLAEEVNDAPLDRNTHDHGSR